jgi:hypothetical protein
LIQRGLALDILIIFGLFPPLPLLFQLERPDRGRPVLLRPIQRPRRGGLRLHERERVVPEGAQHCAEGARQLRLWLRTRRHRRRRPRWIPRFVPVCLSVYLFRLVMF